MARKECHINSSKIDDLKVISGISDKEIRNLVDYRDSHGPFRSLDDLMNVPGFSPSTVEKFKSECDLD